MEALEKYRQEQLRKEKENALAEKRREKRRREEAKANENLGTGSVYLQRTEKTKEK